MTGVPKNRGPLCGEELFESSALSNVNQKMKSECILDITLSKAATYYYTVVFDELWRQVLPYMIDDVTILLVVGITMLKFIFDVDKKYRRRHPWRSKFIIPLMRIFEIICALFIRKHKQKLILHSFSSLACS
ncbi:unnamed protein product [Didymodactylos carnosus]|nr:unnamed protein product [Didymodactylos carnosus]CAF4501504.1 unnamed protein product [Didymodactylos carnosus]